jgi:beta-lactamase regulating signal transducer with metallopeptidase domain
VELLINMTIGGTVTACLILLVKQMMKDRLTPKWHFYLWMILAIRLLVPGLPESEISLLNNMPVTQVMHAAESPAGSPSQNTADSKTGYIAGNIIMKSPVTGAERSRTFSVPEHRMNFLFLGWAAGAVLIVSYLSVIYGLFQYRSKKLTVCKAPEILELFQSCKDEAGVGDKNILLRMGGTTPMLLGIVKPAILFPEGYSSEELRHVFLHELCHYKHKDILINIICCGFLCVYWFNPVMWLCFYLVRRDLEILCDERVIEITGERKEYAKTLLKTALNRNQFLLATTSMQNGEKEVAKRIKHIASFKKPKLLVSVLAVLIVLATGVVCLTNASENTVNLGLGSYYVSVPESWFREKSTDSLFYNGKGQSFGGVNLSQIELGENKTKAFEKAELPLPNHSKILQRKVLKEGEKTFIIVNLDFDTEAAADMEEREAGGGSAEFINQNYIFMLPDAKEDGVYTIWANSSTVSEGRLLKIAKTLKKEPDPQSYQPETVFRNDWSKTAETLLKQYFQNYDEAELSTHSDISGYRIDQMKAYQDPYASWSIVYPDAAVYRVDYTLDIKYPDQYSFAGGGFEIGQGNKTKIYRDQLAVFTKDNLGNARFLGFVLQQDTGELEESAAILRTIGFTDQNQSPNALLKLKTPYLGNNSADGRILSVLPLAVYSNGIELHTKQEPYGLTVYYDLTKLGDKIFESRPDKAPTDSSGWELNPYLKAQLYKNSAILLSLIDNCSTVEFQVKGISETGASYTYYYWKNRQTLAQELSKDPREFTGSEESFTEFMNILEDAQNSIAAEGKSR